jgi:lipopolysaccharide export system permease protein
MKKVHSYIFFKLWPPFLFGLIGTTLISALDPLQKTLDYILKQKVDPWVAWQWFFSSLPKDMLFIFPTASLLAGLLVFAQLSRNSEIIAIQAGGVGLSTILKPVFLFAFMSFILVVLVQDQLIPPALNARNELFRVYIKQYEEPSFRKDVVMRLSGERLLCIGRIDLHDKTLHNIVLSEYGKDSERLISARKATLLEGDKWKLENVRLSNRDGYGRYGSVNQNLPVMEYNLGLDKRDMVKYEMKKSQEMSYGELWEQIKYHETRGVISTIPLWVDFYSKTAFPFAPVIFVILGACLGISSPRRGSFVGFGISLVMTFLYFIIMGLSTPLGKNGLLNPLIAGWTQNFVFILLTIWVIWSQQLK